MKRFFGLLALLLVLLAGILWLGGRAPGAYVLEEECRRFQDERRAADGRLAHDVARLEAVLARGGDPGGELTALRERRAAKQAAPRRLSIRGWEVLLLPASSPRPSPGDFLVAGRFDPSAPGDHPGLRGPMEVWIAPRGALARLLCGAGLAP